MRSWRAWVVAMCWWLALLHGQGIHAQEFFIIPFDVDPPIRIDADLDDWADVPNPIPMRTKAHATYQRSPWRGPSDLSATVRLAWRDGLYVAADVTDNVFQQPFSGYNIWKGDYVDLWVDMKPNHQVERDLPGEGQYHMGISPGNVEGEWREARDQPSGPARQARFTRRHTSRPA